MRVFLTYVLVLACFSTLHGQPRFGLNLEVGIPAGDFRNNTKAEGYGFGFGTYIPLAPERRVSVGAEINYEIYGKHIFTIDGETLSLVVNNNMLMVHGLARVRPWSGARTLPFFEFLYGFKYLYTRSKIKDDLFGEPISTNTDFRDIALSYGGSAGIQIDMGDKVDLEFRLVYLKGGKADYLDAPSIENNRDGTFSFEPKRSYTDMVVVKVGVVMGI